MVSEQKILVQTSFAEVIPAAPDVAALFYARLFEVDPPLRALFHSDMQEQGLKLMDMLALAVAALDRLDELVPALQALGRRHGDYGVPPTAYDTVGAALLWTLEQQLGPRFTPETRAAWVAAYTLLADTMQKAAQGAP